MALRAVKAIKATGASGIFVAGVDATVAALRATMSEDPENTPERENCPGRVS
ncbi:hypothetical protein [Aureimonas ureilytica]|uniref:hypothetical protein n=1 Tax=Aureimonas ureilytica TaxID=401562 RepID=UPI000A91E307|nr:hypothetical protein [Aureimonas ureilytica]